VKSHGHRHQSEVVGALFSSSFGARGRSRSRRRKHPE